MRARLTVPSFIFLALCFSRCLAAQSNTPPPTIASSSPAAQLSSQSSVPLKSCEAIAKAMVAEQADISSGRKRIASTAQTLEEYLVRQYVATLTNAVPCFLDANQPNPDINKLLPQQVSLWSGLLALSGTQQEGSSLSSSGSTNPVSKPGGPTALAEEFGGANVSTATSSLTAQWSPGTLLGNILLARPDYLCGNLGARPGACISKAELADLAPLTMKITANTTNATPSVSGTAATTGSAASSQQVNVSSKGASGPSFSGLSVSYSFGSKTKTLANAITALEADAKDNSQVSQAATSAAKTYLNEVTTELKDAFAFAQGTNKCPAYNTWSTQAETTLAAYLDSSKQEDLAKEIAALYRDLLTQMQNDQDCVQALKTLGELTSKIATTRVAEDVLLVQPSTTPELGLEYDLNTPQNKPAYSSVKVSGNWQFGRPWEKGQAAANLVTAVQSFISVASDINAKSNSANASSAVKQLKAAGKPVAQATTPPWSLTANGTVDIYNAEPPSTIPSASHLRDIQAGAELAYLFSPSSNSGPLREFIGSVRLSGAYSYQDQTSPAILTGPALTDFTGLPSSTTSAYAQRGIIHLGQVKLGLGTGSNLSYPLSFTYSNRTELVTHPTWGLQFGISYNLTSLFASSNPSSK